MNEQLPPIRHAIDHVFTQTRLAAQSTGRATNVKTFVARLNKALKSTGIRVVTEVDTILPSPNDPEHAQYYPAVGGFCYEPSPDKLARIRIVVCIHPETNRLPLTDEAWEYFRYRFLVKVNHELVHPAQFMHGRSVDNQTIFRPYASKQEKFHHNEQKYLGDIDEIEAYARDCVEEWYYLHPNEPLTLRKIKEDFRDLRTFPSIQYYHTAYKGDETHPSIRRFFRKVKIWNDLIQPVAWSLPPAPSHVRRTRFHANIKADPQG